jgi:hypothetical protein
MPLETFNFPYHTFNTENPESGFRGTLGGSYVFTAEPTDPDQRKFILNFPTMKYFTDEDGVVDETINPTLNMFALTKFYLAHKMYKSFHYTHPVHGLLEVKFNKPLVEPDVLVGGGGAVKSFTVELIEIP